MTMEHETKISQLTSKAKKAYNNAYAPYSNFHVGAAAITTAGNIVTGCNVENASYGLTICAERNCIAQAIANGEAEFSQLVVYTEQEQLTPPCGACRQVIAEFFDPDAVVTSVNHLQQKKSWTVEQLLPNAFTPKHLE